ncbi:MAG: PqqD family peptide modification chaperone [Fervidicoccus fontis]
MTSARYLSCILVLNTCTQLLKKESLDYFLLLNPRLFSCARINKSTLEIIELCNGKYTVSDISKILAERYKVSQNQIEKDVRYVLNKLSSLGLLIKVGKDPPQSHEMFSISKGPEEVWLFVTNRCNLKCITCFKNSGTEHDNELSYDEIKTIIDEILRVGRPEIIISGGEPLLRNDLNKILKYIKDSGLRIHIITNGTLLNKKIVEEWASIGVDFVQVSLDGSKPEINDAIRGEGTFSRVMSNVKLLKERNIRFSLYPTITKLNLYDVLSMSKLFCEVSGKETFGMAFFAPVGRGAVYKDNLMVSEEEYFELLRKLLSQNKNVLKKLSGFEAQLDRVPPPLSRKLNCGLASGTIAIDSDGSVYPCQWLMLPEYKAGNIRNSSFREIYFNSEVLRRLRELTVEQIPSCINCQWRYLCGGGCRALSLFLSGSISGPFPLCEFFKKYFENALWGDWSEFIRD